MLRTVKQHCSFSLHFLKNIFATHVRKTKLKQKITFTAFLARKGSFRDIYSFDKLQKKILNLYFPKYSNENNTIFNNYEQTTLLEDDHFSSVIFHHKLQ
jgi:hypothetical protein